VRVVKRKGRIVTVVTGLPLPRKALKELARSWRRKLGVGGTVKGEEIELQGDHAAEVRPWLDAVMRPKNEGASGPAT
jgi:translation initiation factor 1